MNFFHSFYKKSFCLNKDFYLLIYFYKNIRNCIINLFRFNSNDILVLINDYLAF